MSAAQNAIVSRTSRIDGFGGNTNSFWAWNSLRMSFCNVPPSRCPLDARVLGDRDVHRENHCGRRVDRHRRRHRAEVDAGEEVFHVGQRVDGDAALCRPRPHRSGRRSRAPSASADRTRSTGRRRPKRGCRGSVGWCPPPFRSRRTSASSTASTGTSTRTARGCRGTDQGTRRRQGRTPARLVDPTSCRTRRRESCDCSNARCHSCRSLISFSIA